MIAVRYTTELERSKALSQALAFISFGCLVAPPFGGILYEVGGKSLPFVALSLACLINMGILVTISSDFKDERQFVNGKTSVEGVSMLDLVKDPHIACCSGALVIANVPLAFLEPTISKWMQDNLDASEWQQGLIWLPAFFPHVAGLAFAVKFSRKYPERTWLLAFCGLTLEGLFSLFIPFCDSFFLLTIPIGVICFGIALIDTALLPMLALIVDNKYSSMYGSVYAIADIAYCVAYAVGPVVAGQVVEVMGFAALNICVAIMCLMYVPALFSIRNLRRSVAYNKPENQNEDQLQEAMDHGYFSVDERLIFNKSSINREDLHFELQNYNKTNPFKSQSDNNPFLN